jgi:hypothetical protein
VSSEGLADVRVYFTSSQGLADKKVYFTRSSGLAKCDVNWTSYKKSSADCRFNIYEPCAPSGSLLERLFLSYPVAGI